jgi:protein-L-isoaspartate(D-aspartate) O-methyltransferase
LAAAAADVPQTLLGQLAPGGRLVMPLGSTEQVIILVERTDSGFVETRFDAVRFVPLLPGVE